MGNVDAALLPFLHSTDESERDRLLGELILEHASPIVRQGADKIEEIAAAIAAVVEYA